MNSNGNGQEKLFYDDPYEVLYVSISTSGKTLKEVASKIYPGCTPETAKSKLSRALSPDNHDVQPNIEMILTILDETTPEIFLNYLNDRYKYKRAEKLSELTPEEELKVLKTKLREMQLHEHPSFKGII